MRAIERAVRLLTVLEPIMHISKLSFSNLIMATIERWSGLPEFCTHISEAMCSKTTLCATERPLRLLEFF
jgi:hypothetical protein